MWVPKSPTREPRIGTPLYVYMQAGRNLPISAIDEERLDFADPDAPSDQREAKVFPRPAAADEPEGDGFPLQGSTPATPRAKPRHPCTGRSEERRSKRRDPTRLADRVLTSPFFVDPLELSSAQRRKTRRPCPGASIRSPLPLLVIIREPQQRPSQAKVARWV